MIRKFIQFILLTLPVMLWAQSPGGVSSPVVWLKADAGVTTSGSNIATWQNNGTSAGTATPLFPATGAPVLTANVHNFNPAVVDNTPGANSTVTNRDGLVLQNVFAGRAHRPLYTFVIQSQPDLTQQATMISYGDLATTTGALDIPWFASVAANQLQFFWQSPHTPTITFPNSLIRTNNVPSINSYYAPMWVTGTPYSVTVGMNGAVNSSTAANFNATSNAFGQHLYIHGDGGNNNRSDGSISEIITFDRVLTTDEIKRVNTYLAVKYGITLLSDSGVATTDYLSSTQTIWSTTTNNGYNNNIVGIGADNPSSLAQKQSKSVNVGQQLIIGAGNGLSNTNAANPNSLSDGQFLIVGDNGLKQVLRTPLSYTSGTNGDVNFRFEAVWKVQNTGAVGTVTVAWPVGIQNLYLVQSSDGTFATGNIFTPMTTIVTVNGADYNTATITLTDGQFFTLAGFAYAPGGVAGADFWVKSDDAGTIATAWKDHSLNADNIPNEGGVTFAPADRAHNFHPYTTGYTNSKLFHNTASVLNPTTGQLDNVSHSIFSAVRPTSAGTGRITGIDDDLRRGAQPGFSIENGELRFYKFSGGANGDTFTEEPFKVGAVNIVSGIGNNPTLAGGTSTSPGGERVLGMNGIYKTYPSTDTGNRFHLYGQRLVIGYGDWTATGAFPGDIMEVIWYKRPLTANEQSRVNSYLAIKNGTTLAENYLTSNNSIVWDRTVNNGYNNNIFGLARDNSSSLHQKQAASTSINQKLVIGHGSSLSESNADNNNDLTEGQFLLAGDNGLKQSLSVPFVYTSGTNGETNFRFESVWKVQNTNGVGQVTIAWPKGIQNLYLLQSSDQTFASGITYTPITTEVTINGVVYNTTTATLTDGQFFTFAGYAQAPGGVLANLLMWHKADDGVTTPGQKDIWKDFTQNARDVFQPNNVNNQPLLVTDASYAANDKNYKFNFNPFYYFDGTNDFFYNTGQVYFPTTNSPGSAYGVMMNSASTGFRTPYGWGDDDPNFLRSSDDYYVTRDNGTAILQGANASTLPAHIGGMNWRGATNGIYMNVNGRIYATETMSIGSIQSTVNFAIGSEGVSLTGSGNELHQGGLPEVFAYSADHRNSAGDELLRINSYLAIKYGITLTSTDGTTVPNYLSSESVPVWNATTNAGYNNNIFGIAQDFPSALHQKQSTSANSGQKLIIGNGSSLFNTNAENTNSLADGQFLLTGDNGLTQGLKVPLVYTAGSNGETNFRFESIWKVANTNGVGAVTVAWPKGVKNFYLVQSADETFATGNTFTPMTTEVPVNGVIYNTANVTLTDGQFFTFAGYGQAPAGVVNNLSYWYRADKDAANTGAGTDVTSWTDFFSGTVSAQMGTNAFPKYALGAANYFNFNPGINFTANNQSLGNINVRTFSADDYDVFTFTKEGMVPGSGGNHPSIFRSLVDNAFLTGGLRRWDGLGILIDNRIERLSNTGGNTDYYGTPAGGGFSTTATIPSIMYHTFTATTTARALNGVANAAPTNHSGTGIRNLNGGHVFGDSQFSGNGSDNRGFIGHLGETIIYGSGNLTAEERRRVDSYMAIKYGITLERAATDHYLASTASSTSIVWNGATNATYNNNIFGMARADIGAFEQKVSKSVNAGTILTIAKDNDFVSPNDDASRTGLPEDEGYLLLGDNNITTTTAAPAPAIGNCGEDLGNGLEFRMIPRKWMVQRTNDIGTTYLQANLAAYAGSINSEIVMLVADDANFTQNVKAITGTNDGNVWTFAHNFDNENAVRYITFGGTFVTAPCEQCKGGTYTLRTGYQWNQGLWGNQTSNQKLNIALGNDADGNPLTANMYADYSEDPSIEYVPTRYPQQYGGRWTIARRYDNTNAKDRHRIELSQAMKASFQISNINTYLDNKNNFEVIGYCNGAAVMPTITYAYNTSYHTFEINGNQATGTMSWRGFIPNVSTANVRFDRPVDEIVIISSVERVNTHKTLRSSLYGDITLECAEILEPTPDNVYVSHSFTQDTLATCGGETTMRIKVTNNNLCEDKTIDLHQLLPSGLEYVAESFNGNDLPAGAMDNATVTYSAGSFELSGLTLPRGEHWMYIDVANPGTVATYPTAFTFEVTDGVDPAFTYSSSVVNLNYYESTGSTLAAPSLELSIKDNVSCGENDDEITYRMKINNPNTGGVTGAEILHMFDYDQTIQGVVFVSGEDEDGVITGDYPLDGSGNAITPVGSSLFNMIDAVIPEGVSYIDITVNVGNSYDIAEVQALGISSSFMVGLGNGECAETGESISNQVTLRLCSACVKPGATGTALTSSVGILTKAETSVANWPESVPNGYLVLDGAFKGMVITHMTTAEINALTPVEGMLVFDTDEACVKLYRGAGANAPVVHPSRQGWVCIERVCID